ncbi:hypothetical protein SDC9_135102 [bioreactor metagenome]|uniref:4Fe4S-binding SPASM domain-containing protein n=1 Tax=bioreactor metagenome TaxID=1076179 RepID=A0A645DFH5_9ZZZZ
MLSCDGRREIHDFMRPAEDGSGTYDTIMPAFKKLVAERGEKSYYIRGTYTRKNLDFSRDVLAMAAEGFDQISVEPVVLSPESPYSIREEDLPRIRAEYDVLAAELIRRKQKKEGMFNFFHFMVDLDEGPCIYKRIKGCGSGREYISVTPTGDIYPCHQFVGKTEFMMGNVFEGSIDQKIRKQFTRAAVLSIPKCRDCWAKFFCGGGCAANNYSFNSDINIPYSIGCETERKRLECALMLKAAENGEPLEAESPEAKSFEAKKAQH